MFSISVLTLTNPLLYWIVWPCLLNKKLMKSLQTLSFSSDLEAFLDIAIGLCIAIAPSLGQIIVKLNSYPSFIAFFFSLTNESCGAIPTSYVPSSIPEGTLPFDLDKITLFSLKPLK